MQSSVITTHDSVNPNYKIKAKEVRIEGINGPEEKRRIIFNNMTIYAGQDPSPVATLFISTLRRRTELSTFRL